MEDILKKLQGKQLTKSSIFNFLSENISSITIPNTSVNEIVIPALEEPTAIQQPIAIHQPIDFKCDACMKTFVTDMSLKQHIDKSTACNSWLNHPQKDLIIKLSKGIHLVIDDLLNEAISDNGALECKFCKCKFSNKGNHHKHYNSSSVCNNMAYDEFKKLILHK